ncbi:hypothetical protein [Pelagibacterium xiamenense]|uniref:hypothetical protein n=1 Tax=Pelagibacterium xiamenense TaxID=2901140 RepID=UPI001E53A1DE|nr:hypothetical protein [Pelagibacterium xiamenense]MCD7058772.1 hypothetical protein [Pelagibacterium xiamenense]
MFDSSIPQMPYIGAMSKVFRLFRNPVRLQHTRKFEALPGNGWLRHDIGLPAEPDARPRPYLYR